MMIKPDKTKREIKMTLSDLINSIKEIKILSTNGIDENIAIVLDKPKQGTYYERNKQKLSKYYHDHYLLNRKDILQKKKEHNEIPQVKQHNSEYHKAYYQANKQELKSKNKERYRKRKNRKF